MDAFQFNNCIQPPANLLLDRGSRLYLNAVTSQSEETVTVVARLQLPNGKIQSFPRTVSVSAGTVSAFVTDELPQGFLLSCSLRCSVATRRGQTYARVSVYMQDQSFLQVLKAGYITQSKPISYPPIEVEDEFSGYGNPQTFTGTPALEAGPVTVPTNRIWKPIFFYYEVTTGATAGNRYAFVRFLTSQSPASAKSFVLSPSPQPANTTFRYSFLFTGANQTVVTTQNHVVISLPQIVLRAGDEFRVNVQDYVALNDSADVLEYYIEEFLNMP